MGSDLFAILVNLLKDYELMAIKGSAVQSELKLNGTVGIGCLDGLRSSYFGAICVEQCLSGDLINHRTGEGVLLAGYQAFVLNSISQRSLGVADNILVTIVPSLATGGSGLNERGIDLYGLIHIVDVLMACNRGLATVELFERNKAVTVEVCAIEGDLHGCGAVGALRREGSLASDLRAVCLEQCITGSLVHHLADEGVLLAGNEVFIFHGVLDGCSGVANHVLSALMPSLAALCSGFDGGLDNGDGLRDIGNLRMRCDFLALGQDMLEGNKALILLEVGAVEGELDLHCARRCVGDELLLGSHGIARRVLEHRTGSLVHQLALEHVLLARGEAVVGNGIGNNHFGVLDNLLVVVDAVGGDGANYRRLNSHGLALVAKLLMVSEDSVGIVGGCEVFEHDELGGIREVGSVEAELDVCVLFLALSREGDGAMDLVAGCIHIGLAGGLVHQGAVDDVLGALLDVVAGNLVDNGHIGLGNDFLVAIGLVVSLGGDGDILVGQGSKVDGVVNIEGVVTGNREVLLDELVTRICIARELFQGVLIVRKCTTLIVRIGDLGLIAVRVLTEPHAAGRIENLGSIEQFGYKALNALCIFRHDPVVAVGVLCVLVPGSLGGSLAVLVGDDHMALSGGFGSDLERHPSQGMRVIRSRLGELHIRTEYWFWLFG